MNTTVKELAETVAAQQASLDKMAEILGDIAEKVSQPAPAPAPVAAPVAPVSPPITAITTLAPNTGSIAEARAKLPDSKAKTIRKHADGDVEAGIDGATMIRHYLAGTLPKHIGKEMPDGHIYRIIDGRGEYAPSPNGPKAGFALALLAHLETGQALPDAVVATVPAVGATDAERGDALRKACGGRFGETLLAEVLAAPSKHFGTEGQMLSMARANTVRSRCRK